MNILCIGDVFGEAGCDALRKRLPLFKKQNNIDMVIANGENSAAGNGITPDSARYLLNCGVDIITGGNHSFRRYALMDFNNLLKEIDITLSDRQLEQFKTYFKFLVEYNEY